MSFYSVLIHGSNQQARERRERRAAQRRTASSTATDVLNNWDIPKTNTWKQEEPRHIRHAKDNHPQHATSSPIRQYNHTEIKHEKEQNTYELTSMCVTIPSSISQRLRPSPLSMSSNRQSYKTSGSQARACELRRFEKFRGLINKASWSFLLSSVLSVTR